jgi:thiol-disulfide isomerase/thioredoxin
LQADFRCFPRGYQGNCGRGPQLFHTEQMLPLSAETFPLPDHSYLRETLMNSFTQFIASGCLLIASIAVPLRAQTTTAPATQEAIGTSHEKTSDLLVAINSIKQPVFDPSKREDQAYLQKFTAEYRAALEKRKQLSSEFVEKFPNAPEAPDMLLFVARVSEEDQDKQIALYRQIVAKYPGTEAAKAAAGPLRQIDDIGKPFALSFTDAISGKKIDIASLRGKVVVIDFWATWCGPCVGEMPQNKDIYKQYHNKGVEFIGVSLDAPESQGGLTRLKDFVAKNNIPWPQDYQGNAWESQFSQYWGIQSIPTVFVVDTKGNLFSTTARGQLDRLFALLLPPG